LAFKPDIDDLIESTALSIAQKIGTMGFKKQFLVEPNITEIPANFASISKLTELDEVLLNSDIVVLLVDHKPFKKMNLGLFSGKQVVDTKGIWQ